MASRQPSASVRARGFTLLAANLTKLSGAAVALNETLLRSELRPLAVAVAALMISGPRALEAFMERLMGR